MASVQSWSDAVLGEATAGERAMGRAERYFAAARAGPLLTAATSAYGSDYARGRAVNLAGLAGSHARAGDIDTACARS